MANDIDMWNDIEDLEKEMDKLKKTSKKYKDKEDELSLLLTCFYWRYNEYDMIKAEKCKEEYCKKYKWGGYY